MKSFCGAISMFEHFFMFLWKICLVLVTSWLTPLLKAATSHKWRWNWTFNWSCVNSWLPAAPRLQFFFVAVSATTCHCRSVNTPYKVLYFKIWKASLPLAIFSDWNLARLEVCNEVQSCKQIYLLDSGDALFISWHWPFLLIVGLMKKRKLFCFFSTHITLATSWSTYL